MKIELIDGLGSRYETFEGKEMFIANCNIYLSENDLEQVINGGHVAFYSCTMYTKNLDIKPKGDSNILESRHQQEGGNRK